MRTVIRIDEEPKEEKVLKPIEFTHYLNTSKGWVSCTGQPRNYPKIVYLGKHGVYGDLFSAYVGDCINIYKGHLNDGVY